MATKGKVQGQEQVRHSIAVLRQSAVITNSAVRSMEWAFMKTNPERALRRWSTPLVVKKLMSESISYVKGTAK